MEETGGGEAKGSEGTESKEGDSEPALPLRKIDFPETGRLEFLVRGLRDLYETERRRRIEERFPKRPLPTLPLPPDNPVSWFLRRCVHFDTLDEFLRQTSQDFEGTALVHEGALLSGRIQYRSDYGCTTCVGCVYQFPTVRSTSVGLLVDGWHLAASDPALLFPITGAYVKIDDNELYAQAHCDSLDDLRNTFIPYSLAYQHAWTIQIIFRLERCDRPRIMCNRDLPRIVTREVVMRPHIRLLRETELLEIPVPIDPTAKLCLQRGKILRRMRQREHWLEDPEIRGLDEEECDILESWEESHDGDERPELPEDWGDITWRSDNVINLPEIENRPPDNHPSFILRTN